MPRKPSLWRRAGRPGWYATIDGRQVNLGLDRKDAEREFHRLRAESQPVNRSTLTVIEACAKYLAWAESRIKPVTHKNYRVRLKSWCEAAGSVRLVDLRPYHVTAWLEAHKWGASSQHLAISVVKLWSAWCKREGYIEADKLTGMRRPRMGRRAAAPDGAITATMGAVLCQPFLDFATVLLDIGCRPGELRLLEAFQIDWEKSAAVVTGKRGSRLLSLTARSLDILRGYAAKHPTGPVLRNSRGDPWQAAAIQHQFRRCSIRAGFRVVPYACRHDFWRRAHLAGISDLVAAAQMGHKDLKMLNSTYAHVDLEMTKDAVEKASGQSS